MMSSKLVMGIDVGTQGVRVVVVDHNGVLHASARLPFSLSSTILPPGWIEQAPEVWWDAVQDAIGKTLNQLKTKGYQPVDIVALGVDSTSGTLVPVDADGHPLRPAIMYNDNRSLDVLPLVKDAGIILEEKLGYAFQSSFTLPKILWLRIHEPDLFEKTAYFLHAADYILSRMTGIFGSSDHTNALKTGFDVIDYAWPDFIEHQLLIPLAKLPTIVAPGAPIGQISTEAARTTGLSPSTQVVAGMTDGVASQIASGAVAAGEWNSTLGTTLVLKGISKRLLKDPMGRFYCHLHPQGMWMPGGASNTGAEWIPKNFPGREPAEMVKQASSRLPTNLIAYPLMRRGERFPFIAPHAEGFIEGEPADGAVQFAAMMEGVAFLERLAYETLESLGAEVGSKIYVTGGGARSDIWLQVRASVLDREMVRPILGEAAMGSALLAASHTLYQDLAEAIQHMVRIATKIEPKTSWREFYETQYQYFTQACQKRGYFPE